jgi:quercetin dioxygenase-like cupin family protein
MVVCASTRGEFSMIREKSHAADTTRLCRSCVLRDLRGNGVYCDRCVGARHAACRDVRGYTKDLAQTDGPTPGYVTIIAEAEIEAGVTVARHTHPGIESAYIIEGGLELPIEGQPTRALKPGDGFQVPPNTPHAGGKNGDKKTKIAITYVLEKGKPIASPA